METNINLDTVIINSSREDILWKSEGYKLVFLIYIIIIIIITV